MFDQRSDFRFLLRLFISWTLYLVAILGLAALILTALGVSLTLIGHTFVFYTGYMNPADHMIVYGVASNASNSGHPLYHDHSWRLLGFDFLIGTLVAAMVFGAFCALILIGIALHDHHYLPWKKACLASQGWQDKTRQPEQLLDFVDLDDGKRSFWQTIPECLWLVKNCKSLFNRLQLELDIHFPPGSDIRYFLHLCKHFLVVVAAVSSILGALFCVGYLCTPEWFFLLDSGKAVDLFGKSVVRILLGLYGSLIAGLIGYGIWESIIKSCLREWRLHQRKVQDMGRKQD